VEAELEVGLDVSVSFEAAVRRLSDIRCSAPKLLDRRPCRIDYPRVPRYEGSFCIVFWKIGLFSFLLIWSIKLIDRRSGQFIRTFRIHLYRFNHVQFLISRASQATDPFSK
jgi:hypothetical protein